MAQAAAARARRRSLRALLEPMWYGKSDNNDTGLTRGGGVYTLEPKIKIGPECWPSSRGSACLERGPDVHRVYHAMPFLLRVIGLDSEP